MQEAFPELKLEKQEKQARQCDISHIKYALETTVIESEVNFEANCEIRRNTAEECIETINQHVISKDRGGRQDILIYSSIQGELLATLKKFFGPSFYAMISNATEISRSHAFFLMRFFTS